MTAIPQQIASEIVARPHQVEAAIALLDEGATVPFIARYRKERTGGLDDQQLRVLETRLQALRELEARKLAILKNIDGQGKLTSGLKTAILSTTSRTELEDLYLPYKQKRQTKAQKARESGLEPLAEKLLKTPSLSPDSEAGAFIDPSKGIENAEAALEGVSEIIAEKMSEDAVLLKTLRKTVNSEGRVRAKVKKGMESEAQKYTDYFDFSEDFTKIPSHRALALFRALDEKMLSVSLDVEAEGLHPCEFEMRRAFDISDKNRPADAFLCDAVHNAWLTKLKRKIVGELMGGLREKAESEAIDVFARNMKDLLLAAPAGDRAVMGLDPGFRTGVKVAVVDGTGKLLDTDTIYPHQPQNQWDKSLATLARLAKKHKVEIISIGNGTASRETDRLSAELIKKHSELNLMKVVVSEAGASVYSASELAAKEFPDLDVSIRGAVSIARRLQDPLAELVKIEPKSIGVGQYQHDVNQSELGRSLESSVEDCVNAVGVDVNTASAALLTHIAGLNSTIAGNIVAFRDENGPFKSRAALKKVPRLGAKAFEQGAGFLRIREGKNPLDASAVHPEAYGVVEKVAKAKDRSVKSMIGDSSFLQSLKPEQFADDTFGVPTVTDILSELDKPGRDPRPSFKAATFAEGVEKISDVKEGMRLEGVVTNITAFGAFIDIGVHQDGLVHISQLSDQFVSDPHKVVKTGDIVKVKVLEVDVERKRISLSMKSGGAGANDNDGANSNAKRSPQTRNFQKPEKQSDNVFADAFKKKKGK